MPNIDIDEMVRLYVEEGMTQREIGEALGVGQPTVSKWLRSRDVEARVPALELSPIPHNVRPEDRRKLEYIRGEVIEHLHGQREPEDVELLQRTYADILRAYPAASWRPAGATYDGNIDPSL